MSATNLAPHQSDAEVAWPCARCTRATTDPLVHRMIERHTVGPQDDVPLVGKIEIP